MGNPDRFSFRFAPNYWALPLCIGFQRTYYGSGKQFELVAGFGPFSISAIFGKFTND